MSDQGLRSESSRLLATLLKLVCEPKASLEELAMAYSDRCDAVILAAEASEGLSFVGGRLAIALRTNGREVEVQMKAYFKNACGEWLNKSNLQVCDVESVLALPAIQDLRRVGRVEFDLEKPAQSKSSTASPQR